LPGTDRFNTSTEQTPPYPDYISSLLELDDRQAEASTTLIEVAAGFRPNPMIWNRNAAVGRILFAM
jgi:hypothetical protein